MTSQPTSHVRWFLVFLLFVLSAVAFLDRVNLSIAGAKISEEFGISNIRLGLVFSAFLFGYALFQTPAGWLADRFGPLPAAAEQLLDIVRIRIAARVLGVERVEAGEGQAVITFAPSTPVEPQALVKAIQSSRGRLKLKREFTVQAAIARDGWAGVRDSLLGVLRSFAPR